MLDQVARRGRLRVPPAEAAAAAQILAANVGVTFSLITKPEAERDLAHSERVREAALAAVLTSSSTSALDEPSRASAAIALNAALETDSSGLSRGELTLLRELLERIGDRLPGFASATGGNGANSGP